MCEICLSYPCLSRCPNAKDPEPVKICALCGEGIHVGEQYYQFEGESYHDDCFKDNLLDIVLDSNLAEKRTAEN